MKSLILNMVQTAIIVLLLTLSAFYLGRLVYRSFTSTSCASGCGSCNSIDVDAIMKKMKEKETTLG
ncbi:MAG: hypothetical protein RLN86_14110 [Cyclobacteriaceae bacterium]